MVDKPVGYGTDAERLKAAQAIVGEYRADLVLGRTEAEVASRLTAMIQSALESAHRNGAHHAVMGDMPPMRLGVALTRMGIGRVLPNIADDFGRNLPGVVAISIDTDLDPPDFVTVKLVVDGDRVRLVDGAGEPA